MVGDLGVTRRQEERRQRAMVARAVARRDDVTRRDSGRRRRPRLWVDRLRGDERRVRRGRRQRPSDAVAALRAGDKPSEVVDEQLRQCYLRVHAVRLVGQVPLDLQQALAEAGPVLGRRRVRGHLEVVARSGEGHLAPALHTCRDVTREQTALGATQLTHVRHRHLENLGLLQLRRQTRRLHSHIVFFY